MVYDMDKLEEVHRLYGNDSGIRSIFENRIKSMRKNGFYIDTKNGETTSSSYEKYKDFIKQNSGVDISTNYETKFVYDFGDGIPSHSFIHIKPNGFKFTYFDFASYYKVLHVVSPVIYLNSCWGIYVENEKLKIHDIIQYDFFEKTFMICPNNMYDGGNNLLPYSNTYFYGLNGSRSGGVFENWDEFLEAHRNFDEYAISENERCIEMHKNDINDCKKRIKTIKSELKKKMKHLNSLNVPKEIKV